jgi:hypothetical protein
LFYSTKVIPTQWIKRITNMQIIYALYLCVGIDGCHDVVVVDLHPIMSYGWRRSIPQQSRQNVFATRIEQKPEAPARSCKNRIVRFGKLDSPAFVDSNGNQGHRRHSMMELLLRPSDVWTEDSQEPWQPKWLNWRILDLIYEKKKT